MDLIIQETHNKEPYHAFSKTLAMWHGMIYSKDKLHLLNGMISLVYFQNLREKKI